MPTKVECTHTMFIIIKKKVKFCVFLPPPICALPNHVFIRIYSIHLNTCSRVDVYTMRGNKNGTT